ncbi:hypothetical protein POPTR_019G014354v4 [Populus trichocarpa]|uniref:Uncharacterized protein n=1 Tax=Populus trichocarpa TaxID=3694 RepID=A0ACC0RKF8_POPTR|nr:hypothetical protein POPTR_019G014354v4 [Populus trichocarpa]
MEGFQPSFMEEVDNMTWDQLGFQSEEDTFNMSELLSLPPEVPVNQSSISCNDQGGQNNVINDSIQQTTPFPTSFPETVMEGFPPSSMDDLESLFLSPAPEVPVNQGSISCNDQGGHKNVINDSIQQTTQFPTSFPETMTGHGYMTPNATTSQHGEFNQPGPSSLAPWYRPNPNLFDPQCANPLRDQQLTNYQLPMSNQVPAMLPGPQPPRNQWHQYSNIHQPHTRTSRRPIKNYLAWKERISGILFFDGEWSLFKESPPSITVTRNPNWSTEILWSETGYVKGKILSPLKRPA